VRLVRTVKLGEVAEFVRGVTYKPTDVTTADDPSGIPCLRTKNIQEKLEDEDLVFIPKAPIKDSKLVSEGDILVSSANSWNLVGKCSWIPTLPYKATFGGFTSVLRSNQSTVDRRYLYRWFSSPRIQELARSFGQQTTNISNLNQGRCLELEIPLPPLDEQKRIAATLDKADQLRQKRRQATAMLDSLTQSIFLEMFGDPVSNPRDWPLTALGLLQAVGPNFGSMQPPSKDVREWISLRVANIQNWEITLEDTKYIDLNDNEIERFTLKDGDIILARAIASQEHLGKCVVVNVGSDKLAFDSHLMRIRLNQQTILPEFLRELFRTPGGRTIFLKSTRKTTVQYNINTKELNAIKIPLPPLVEQRQFVEQLRKLSAVRSRINENMRRDLALFSSLQHRAFSGQL